MSTSAAAEHLSKVTGLTWNPDFLRSPQGMAMAVQVVSTIHREQQFIS